MTSITWYGHSAFLLRHGDVRILVDPFLTGNPKAPCGAEAVEADVILLTHGHGDHVGDTVAIAQRTGATVVAPYELGVYLQAQGCPAVECMNHGGGKDFAWGRVVLTPAVHSSSVQQPDGTSLYLGNPSGHVIRLAGGPVVYNTGDTALSADLFLVGERHRPDVLLLPIGDYFTMGIDDAAELARKVRPRLGAFPLHYDTFPPIRADVARFAAAIAPVPALVAAPGTALALG